MFGGIPAEFLRFVALSRPCKPLLSNNSEDFAIPPEGPLLTDGWSDALHSTRFCRSSKYQCTKQRALSFNVGFLLVVSERILGRCFLQNCAELLRQPMFPIVFCSVSFSQSFAFGSTRPVAICTRSGGDRSTALLLFSRTHPLHFSLDHLIQQTSRSATFGSPNLLICTKCICGCLCDGRTYSLWTSLHRLRSPVVAYPVRKCRCRRSSQLCFSSLSIVSNVRVEVSQQYYGACPWDSLKHTTDFIQERGIF